MMKMHTLVVLLCGLFLTACGFTPMYASSNNQSVFNTQFSSIAISHIPDRLGQKVHNALLDQLTPMGPPSAPQYILRVTLDENLQGFGFRKDESITRQNFRLNAHYQLIDINTDTVITSGDVSSHMAFDVVQSDFANHTALEDAKTRTAQQVVVTLVLRLGSFFNSRDGTS